MVDINLSQLLANTVSFLTCASILGAFFAYHSKAIRKTEIAVSLERFEKDKLTPLFVQLDSKIREFANINPRLAAVEQSVKTLTDTTTDLAHTITDNAVQHRQDLTGLGTRLSQETKNQTDLIVKIIEAKK